MLALDVSSQKANREADKMEMKYTYTNDAKAAMRQLRKQAKETGAKPSVWVDIGFMNTAPITVNFKQVQQIIDKAVENYNRMKDYEWVQEVSVVYTIEVWSNHLYFSAKVECTRNDEEE